MEREFWLNKWQKNEIGFHNSEAHPLLVGYFDLLKLQPGARIFLPLCGKSLDIGWLVESGFQVVGAELSEAAVAQLFEQFDVEPEITQWGPLKRYSSQGLAVFAGDIFDLDREQLGHVDAIYDRAALIALPEMMRARYASHMINITGAAQQLLVSMEYDQQLMPGPPFCVTGEELQRVYGTSYQLTKIHAETIAGGLKGKCPAEEVVWLLQA